jgi:hypothetical protein
MVLVEVDAVVVLATSVTATTGVLPVLANATVTGADVSSLSNLLRRGRATGSVEMGGTSEH